MNIQKVKQGAKITLYNGVYMIFYGIFYIFFLKMNMRQNFREINELWGFFIRYDANIAVLFTLFNVFIGILLISNGIFIIYLSDYIIKRKDKMTWVVLFLSGIISWGGILTISILLKNVLLIVTAGIGWLSFIIGMLIPISYYLRKSYKVY
ncbi:hypothetical protein GOV12_04585 [Candidatus Pacearchaeota archaeon]|nr:hypothetical protein [Candidatus Pacearchaeota archaeon]